MSRPHKRARDTDSDLFGAAAKQKRGADGAAVASSPARAKAAPSSSSGARPHTYTPAEVLELIRNDKIRVMPPRRNPNGGKSVHLEVHDPRPEYRQLRIILGPFRLAFEPDALKGPDEQPVANLEGSADGYPGVPKMASMVEMLQALDELILTKSTLPQADGGLGLSDKPLSRDTAESVFKQTVKDRGDGRPPTVRIKVRRLKDDQSNIKRATMAYDVDHNPLDAAVLHKDSTFTAIAEPNVWQVGSGFGIGFYATQLIASSVAESTEPVLGANDLMLEPTVANPGSDAAAAAAAAE